MPKSDNEKWLLDRFAFAARFIQGFALDFGWDVAERATRDALSRYGYSEETKAALRTAFGD